MESGGHRSGSDAVPGAGAEGGLLCHACGYQYPNAHPSAKQRRAHRKHCGKPASPAAEEGGAGEAEGRVLVPGGGGGAGVGGGGDGTGAGAGAAECGAAVPVSAQEAASAAVDVDKTEHYSHDVAGSQVIVDKCVEDRSDVASGITQETNRADDGGTLNEVAMEYSGKASLTEEGVPSVPASAVSSEQLQDVSVPILPPEPGYAEGVSPELSASEMQIRNVVSQASDATGGDIYEQTNDVISEPNVTTVTGADGTAISIGKDIPIEENSVKSDDLDSSYQENLQTTVGEGHGNTVMEGDSSNKNLNAVQIEGMPNDKPELNQQSCPTLTSSIEVVPNTEDEEPVKSGTLAPVATYDFHSVATDTVKPQEQPDSTSVSEDHLAVPERADIFEGEHYPNKDGGIEMISSAMGPVVNAEVMSVGDADNMTKNVSSSDVIMGDTIQENVTSNSVVPSQDDLVDLSTSFTAHEINMVNSTNEVEEKGQNENSVADLTTHEIEVHVTELVEEKQLDEEIVADSISHETNASHRIDNYGENEKETIAAASSCNIPSRSSIKEEKQIEELIANSALEKANMTSNRNGVEENKQVEVDAKTNRETSVVCTTKATEEMDTTSELNAENITDNIEDKKQSEEISASNISDGTSMVYTTVNEEKMNNEDMTGDPSSDEKTVVHITDNVEEKKYEEAIVDPTSPSVGMVTTIDSGEERNNDKTSADLTSHGTNAEHTTDNVKEKDGEPILEPLSSKISTLGSGGDVEEKQNKETTEDQISGENNTLQSTHDAEKGTQNKDVATVLVSDKSEVAKIADAVEGIERNNETTAKEISNVQSMDGLKGAGQNEEIADKEVIMDSDRSHVSLKVLLANKNVETKEKKPSTKDRVLSFRHRSSKDNESPVKPGSPKAGSGQQDWNSPARLPAEKKSKGKKQQWVPFICCSSIH